MLKKYARTNRKLIRILHTYKDIIYFLSAEVVGKVKPVHFLLL